MRERVLAAAKSGELKKLVTAMQTTAVIVKVQTRRLDALLPDTRIKLLKLEAEGAEPEAIEGCRGILPRIEYISADVGFERGVEQTNTMAPVTNYLLANGFELVDVGQKRLVALYRNAALGGRPRA